jgi:hypothetical protein
MALQTLWHAIDWPGNILHGAGAPNIGGDTTLDAAAEYQAHVIQATEAMVISHVGFKLQTATGSPTADVRIETVDGATGVPTGTLWATDTNIVTGALTTTFTAHALTASATIAKGQFFAVKIVYASGTSIVTNVVNSVASVVGLPYAITNVTGSAVKGPPAGRNWAVGSSATTWYPVRNFLPVASIAANAFNNTNSARRGVRFQVPFKCLASGFRYYCGTAVGDFDASIRDDAGNELSSSSTSFEGDNQAAAAAAMNEFYFDNGVILVPGVWYRLAIEPTTTTNCNMYTATLPSLNYRSAWPGGTNFFYTTFTSGGGWVDTATDQVPLMDLLIRQLDDGVSGVIGC